MTVWERIDVLQDEAPSRPSSGRTGARTSTAPRSSPAIININGRDVAIYGHDFTVRAGSMDATNGRKLAQPHLPGRRTAASRSSA